MPQSVLDPAVSQALQSLRAAARNPTAKQVQVAGNAVSVPRPYPSPTDWRDKWIYFLLVDRFNNPGAAPTWTWNQSYGFRQGGTFEGVRTQLAYLQDLGVGAIWISPVLKNSRPPGWAFVYPGYNTQNFLALDDRFASDGTEATAEVEYAALVDEAHARGMHVIQDIVINHAGRVFDYLLSGQAVDAFSSAQIMNGPLGDEPPIQWMNGLGFPRSDWQGSSPVPGAGADDAVWPIDLQFPPFFRRRGQTLSDAVGPEGFVPGDFGVMRQFVGEYDASDPGQAAIRAKYGVRPVLSILVQAYQYMIAKYDIDGFRIDTVKYVEPDIVQTFGNAIREFALSVGKSNFFTFGEIYDDEAVIEQFVGRDSSSVSGFGVDAALDYPLFYLLPNVIKGFAPVESLQAVFEARKAAEAGQISSHGEAGQYFVSFIDNHDQNQRFATPGTPSRQVSMALAVLFGLQGIPCVYYGTEQGLTGTVDAAGNPTLNAMESVREALWGKPAAFDETSAPYQSIQAIAAARTSNPALQYGRLYFREVAGDGVNFGFSSGIGGLVAFSRILSDQEVVVVANTSGTAAFHGAVLVDLDISPARGFRIAYSNLGTVGTPVSKVAAGTVDGTASSLIASLPIALAPQEVQILVPA
jgi:glycosidase